MTCWGRVAEGRTKTGSKLGARVSARAKKREACADDIPVGEVEELNVRDPVGDDDVSRGRPPMVLEVRFAGERASERRENVSLHRPVASRASSPAARRGSILGINTNAAEKKQGEPRPENRHESRDARDLLLRTARRVRVQTRQSPRVASLPGLKREETTYSCGRDSDDVEQCDEHKRHDLPVATGDQRQGATGTEWLRDEP